MEESGSSPLIVLSGGWGYGNMGDDALLIASVNLIRNHWPESRIRVITYNLREAQVLLSGIPNLTIHESIHKKLFRPRLFTVDTQLTFSYRLRQGLCSRLAEGRMNSLLNHYVQSPQDFRDSYIQVCHGLDELMVDADYYIMGGGGYLNDWPESIVTKHLESLAAKAHGLTMLMVGQTIGPFSKKPSRQLCLDICSMMNGMFFRDKESIRDCGKQDNIVTHAVPDLALFEEIAPGKKCERITFIPFKTDVLEHKDYLAENLKAISQSTGCTITVAITQQWQNSLSLAVACYLYFKQQGIDAELVIPRNVESLQDLLASSKLLLSQNLHGLILAYRAGTNIISLNTDRKFKGFMEKVHLSDYLFDLNTANGLSLAELAASIPTQGQIHDIKPLRQEILEAFNSLIRPDVKTE